LSGSSRRNIRTLAIALAVSLGATAGAPSRAAEVHISIAPGASAGTLLMPKLGFTGTGVVIVAGSGPTDRNGNQPTLQNNSLKMLAEALARRGVATVRYDKRFSGRTRLTGYGEAQIRFGHFVDDAAAWAAHLKKQPGVKRIAFLGHSQGGLVATLAATRTKADGLILLAAPGFNIADTLKRQLGAQLKTDALRKPVFDAIDRLRAGKPVPNYAGPAPALFRPSIQPFLISWMAHDPAERLRAFAGRVLIVQGTRDLQVNAGEAARLKKARPAAGLVTVKGMNHVLKAPLPGRLANIAAYRDPKMPLAPGLVDAVAAFLTAAR